MSSKISLAELKKNAALLLKERGVSTPEVDAELLLAHTLSISRGQLASLIITDGTISVLSFRKFLHLLSRRAHREPLQHITGIAPFRNLELAVGPGVFVPRPETETLVQIAIDTLRDRGISAPLIADLGTGSGAIALALATEISAARVWAVEKSAEAFAWAQKNVRRVRTNGVHLVHADIVDALGELDGSFEMVVSNPPYIPEGATPHDEEVRRYDPHLALYGGEDGLDVIQKISSRAKLLLQPGGTLLLEHGENQAKNIRNLLVADGWVKPKTFRDLTGRDRVTRVTR